MTGPIRATPQSGELAAMALVGGAATVAAVVMFGSRSPLFVIAALIGGVGLVYAARRPLLALVAMVAIEASNLSGVLEQHGNVPVFQASMALGLLAVVLGLRDSELRARLNVWTVICAGLLAVFLATQMVAAIGSADLAASLSSVRRTAIDLLFLMLVLMLAQMTARPWTVAITIVTVLALLSVLTVIDFVVFGGTNSFGGFSIVTTSSGELVTTPRYGGPLPDSNFWGRHLIMGLPLAAALLTRSLRASDRRAVTLVALSILALLAGIYLTQSRGTFLSAGIAMVVWFIASERSIRRWALVALPAVFASSFVPGIGNRLQDMFQQISQGDESSHVDPSLLGRLAAQEQAAMMWSQRPYFGFGPGTFAGEVINFAGRVSTAVREPNLAAHNLYLSLLAETGVFGLIGWTVMVAGFLAIIVLRIIAQPRSADRVLVAALAAAIVGWSVSSVGLHLSYFRTFALVLAMVAAVAPQWPVSAEIVRRFLRNAGIWLVATALGGAFFWAYLTANSTSVFRASQHMTLVPAQPPDGWYAYALDVRSRIEMLPTMGRVLRDGKSPVTIEADAVRGLLTFTAEAESADQARDEVQRAAAVAGTRLSEVNGYDQYLLQTVGSMQITQTSDHTNTTVFVAVAVGIAGGLVTGMSLFAMISGRRTDDQDSVTQSSTDDRVAAE
ncbi:O-antigen ligase [Mycolicibacterium sp. BK556]|uniref:O-antigen ligase family protein n=1 Tax=unclassified Mycolicibacterium TaxID=2636767 RepID=UPI00160CE2BF|nr:MULTISPECIES: O-antigen ligase family protein [unclassified Mycolicibacterium]MBB3605184.1 O-antigen ligase [Mycolicibacterium sp. BK556]MBB3635380.1 O-antigen ligase [Mycolicibacterium sp. BK607]